MSAEQRCPERERLPGLLAGKASPAEVEPILAHLRDCAACRQAMDGLAGLSNTWPALVGCVMEGKAVSIPALHQGAQALHQAGEKTALAGDVTLPPADTPGQAPVPAWTTGHYQIKELVGQGGMGKVFRAFDPNLDRFVAIKVLGESLAANGSARQRFLREARAAAKVVHEHVVVIHAVDETDGAPYLVMQFVAGRSLQDRIDADGPLPVKEIVRIGMQTAAGLAAAHKQGLVHRDVKPANILLEEGDDRVKLTDFGLARAVDDVSLTQSGTVAGTPLYMSPEQANAEPIDHRSDLFSLGSVLYIMATGKPPFPASSSLGVLLRVVQEQPTPIRELRPELPDWLEKIVAKLHAKDVKKRFQSADEVVDLLGKALAKVQAGGRTSPVPTKKRPAATSVLPPVAPSGLQKTENFPAPAPIARPAPRKSRGWLLGIGIFAAGLLAAGLTWGLGAFHRPASDPSTSLTEVEKPQPAEEKKDQPPIEEGWVRLFNGTDLAGWRFHPKQPGGWRVEKGLLIGENQLSHLFSDRELQNFHLRAEAKINASGRGGIYFRGEFGLNLLVGGVRGNYPDGYQTAIYLGDQGSRTGGLVRSAPTQRVPHKADEWFLIEVVASDRRIVVKVDGQVVTDFTDAVLPHRKGHFILESSENSRVEFRKIEVKELPGDTDPSHPFVVQARAGRVERACLRLADAVQAARPGDVILFRGNGPFHLKGVNLRHKPLVLRAAPGYHPVIRADLAAGEYMLQTDAALVVEGLAFIVHSDIAIKERNPCVIRTKAPLFCANCDFLLSSSRALVCHLFDTTEFEIRNCRSSVSAPVVGYFWAAPDDGRGRFINNQFTGGFSAVTLQWLADGARPIMLSIDSSTLVGAQSAFHVRPVRPALKKQSRRVRLALTDSVLGATTSPLTLDLGYPVRDFAEHKEFYHCLSWTEHRNLYGTAFAWLRHAGMIDEQRRYQVGVRAYAGWKRLWNLQQTDSVLAAPQFVGGRQRLQPGSPGTGASATGKDLGCDTSLVGSTDGYLNWKKSPAFRAWVKRTRAAVR